METILHAVLLHKFVEIRAIIEQAGFVVERVYLAGFAFFNLYRLLVIARGKRLAQDVETSIWRHLFRHGQLR